MGDLGVFYFLLSWFHIIVRLIMSALSLSASLTDWSSIRRKLAYVANALAIKSHSQTALRVMLTIRQTYQRSNDTSKPNLSQQRTKKDSNINLQKLQLITHLWKSSNSTFLHNFSSLLVLKIPAVFRAESLFY